MSRTYPGKYGEAIVLEFPSSCQTGTEPGSAQSLPTPFDPHTKEAHALRGAFSFLFTLIAFYTELLDQDALATGDPERRCGLH